MLRGELLLLLMILIPLLGALLAAAAQRWARTIELLATALVLMTWGLLWVPAAEGPISLSANGWFSPLFQFELQGSGFPLVGLVALVALIAVIAGWFGGDNASYRETVVTLLVEFALLGLATARNLSSFLLFWELSFLPLFWLMENTGNGGLAKRLIVTSLLTSSLLWLGVAQVCSASGLSLDADFGQLRERLGEGFARWRLWWFLPAFCFRLAAVPMHTWLGRALSSLPTAPGMMLVGGVCPVAVLCLDKVVWGIAGERLGELSQVLLWLGVSTVLTGGISSLAQGELKKLLAYVYLANGGLLLAGFGVEGGKQHLWLVVTSIGISGAAFFLFSSVVCRARQSQRLMEISGLWKSHPFFAGLSFAAVASLAVVPGTAGFSGTLGLLRSMAAVPLAACLAAAGLILSGLAIIWAYRFILGGSYLPSLWVEGNWPSAGQVIALFVFALLLALLGVAPGLLPLPTGVGS